MLLFASIFLSALSMSISVVVHVKSVSVPAARPISSLMYWSGSRPTRPVSLLIGSWKISSGMPATWHLVPAYANGSNGQLPVAV